MIENEQKITEQSGSFIKDAVEGIQEYLNISEDMGAQLLLPMMSIVLGTKVHTYNGAMVPLKANLWTIILADSGVSAKSTTLDMVKKLVLEKLTKKTRANYEVAKGEYAKLKPAEKENTTEPQLQQLFSGQGSTFSGMIKNLSKNPHGLLASYDEGSEFLNKMLTDKQQKASFTSLYEQSSYGKDMVGKEGKGEVTWINNPFVSLILISNPHWFNSDVKNSDFVSGFLNRFSIVQIGDKIEMVPFANQKKHNFEKFQNVALKIWDYLDGFKEPLAMKVSKEAIVKYQEWFSKQNYSLEDDTFQNAEEYNAFLVRQRTAVLKYAMIIQLFDTFYENTETLNHEIQLKYLNIGINIAEHNMDKIKHLLYRRADDKLSETRRNEQYEEIAKKVKYHLIDKGYDEENTVNTSKVIKGVWSLNKTNFDAVMRIASEKYGVKSVSREFRGGQVANYFYYPSHLDRYSEEADNDYSENYSSFLDRCNDSVRYHEEPDGINL